MSLYNELFGINEQMPVLLGMIEVNTEFFKRFRDIDLIHNGTKIRVMTRIGGENRRDYKETWDMIRLHKLYLGDYDDSFDETYAYIEFKVPDKYIGTTKSMFKAEPISFKEKFDKNLEEMQIPGTKAYEKSMKIAKKISDAIDSSDDSDNTIKFIGL